jgi:hypothetical protein
MKSHLASLIKVKRIDIEAMYRGSAANLHPKTITLCSHSQHGPVSEVDRRSNMDNKGMYRSSAVNLLPRTITSNRTVKIASLICWDKIHWTVKNHIMARLLNPNARISSLSANYLSRPQTLRVRGKPFFPSGNKPTPQIRNVR